MRAHAGLTLIETLIAGAVAAIVLTATFRGILVATRICHEHAQLLAAEAYAWETAWQWMNKSYEALPATTTTFQMTDEDCPTLSADAVGAAASCVVRVRDCAGDTALARHGDRVNAKCIEVNVMWGAREHRRALNDLSAGAIASAGVPIRLYKGSIERNSR